MRALFLALAVTLALPATALAQDAEPAVVAPTLPSAVWTTSEVETVRFLDATIVGPRFETGDELEVLDRAGDRYRVRKGDAYGWLPISTVSVEAPGGVTLDLGSLNLDPSAFGRPSLPPAKQPASGGAGAGE